jgi:hypothetical protein
MLDGDQPGCSRQAEGPGDDHSYIMIFMYENLTGTAHQPWFLLKQGIKGDHGARLVLTMSDLTHKSTFLWPEGDITRVQYVGSSRRVPAGGHAYRPVPFTHGACLHDLQTTATGPFENTTCLRTAQRRTSAAAAWIDWQRTGVTHDHTMACCTAAYAVSPARLLHVLIAEADSAFGSADRATCCVQSAATMALVQIHGCADNYMATLTSGVQQLMIDSIGTSPKDARREVARKVHMTGSSTLHQCPKGDECNSHRGPLAAPDTFMLEAPARGTRGTKRCYSLAPQVHADGMAEALAF